MQDFIVLPSGQQIFGTVVRNYNYADFEEVERALAYLNPFVPRDQWLVPIQALAHAFGEKGRDLAHRWSRGDLWAGGPDVHA